MKNILLLGSVLVVASACTHRNVDVNRVDDASLSCSAIKAEIDQLSELENDIDEKTGLSGRNVGMALLFWPGILVNEMNASEARDRAADRKQKMVKIYGEKSCS